MIPLSFTELYSNEEVWCSVVLQEFELRKMFFDFFGPSLYKMKYTRYHGYLTDKRLILEVFPFGSTDQFLTSIALKAGRLIDDNVTMLQRDWSLAKIRMEDHNLQSVSVQYTDILSIEMVKSLGILKLVQVKIKNQVDLVFQVTKCDVSFKDMAGNTTFSQLKKNYLFTDEFVNYFQNLLRIYSANPY